MRVARPGHQRGIRAVSRLAGLLPGTPAYPYQAIHSSIGNISAPDGKLVDPDRNREDRDLLDRLADAVEGGAGR